MQLLELQRQFAAYALCGENLASIAPFIKDNSLTAEQHLNIYRNNTQLGLTEALRDGYPVVNKLIGEACFNRLARDYIRQHPPIAGCLLYYGQAFAEFIAGHPMLMALPYLADVARLEWLWREAFHEADAKALCIQDLAKIAPEQYPGLSLQLHPSVRLLVSNFPVLTIWQSNQDDYQGDGLIDLNLEINRGSSRLLIFRPALAVLMLPLLEAEYQFLLSMQQGRTLTETLEKIAAIDPAFDLLAILRRWLAQPLFTGFFIPNTNH